MKYRKKPVVIEATQWFKHGDHPSVLPHVDRLAPDQPMHATCHNCGRAQSREEFFATHGLIGTLEDLGEGQLVCPGDWIITGVKGEMYPCKPDIFAATYEPAAKEPQP